MHQRTIYSFVGAGSEKKFRWWVGILHPTFIAWNLFEVIFLKPVLWRYEPSTFGYYAFGYCLAVNSIHLLCMILCFVITCFYLVTPLIRFCFHTCVAQLLRWIGLELRHVLFSANQVTCFNLVLLFSWKNVWNEILQSLYVNNY